MPSTSNALLSEWKIKSNKDPKDRKHQKTLVNLTDSVHPFMTNANRDSLSLSRQR